MRLLEGHEVRGVVEGQEAPVDGVGGLAGELLKDDGTQQVLEWGATALNLELNVAASIDDSTQMRIHRLQVPYR